MIYLFASIFRYKVETISSIDKVLFICSDIRSCTAFNLCNVDIILQKYYYGYIWWMFTLTNVQIYWLERGKEGGKQRGMGDDWIYLCSAFSMDKYPGISPPSASCVTHNGSSTECWLWWFLLNEIEWMISNPKTKAVITGTLLQLGAGSHSHYD